MARTLATVAEAEVRRKKVFQLRELYDQSETQIATALGIDHSTVSRILKGQRSYWRKRYKNLDSAVVFGKVLAKFDEAESVLWREKVRLDTLPMSTEKANSMTKLIATIVDLNMKRIDFMGEYGMLKRTPTQFEVRVRADDLRVGLREIGFLQGGDQKALPPAEDVEDAEVVDAIADPVSAWLAQDGPDA